ncbi:hypothetical protein QJS66_05660 [Kocuria rhizophila]|nr:hypothetical protein QJS66_05660 [Kocuria rhizophila]
MPGDSRVVPGHPARRERLGAHGRQRRPAHGMIHRPAAAHPRDLEPRRSGEAAPAGRAPKPSPRAAAPRPRPPNAPQRGRRGHPVGTFALRYEVSVGDLLRANSLSRTTCCAGRAPS